MRGQGEREPDRSQLQSCSLLAPSGRPIQYPKSSLRRPLDVKSTSGKAVYYLPPANVATSLVFEVERASLLTTAAAASPNVFDGAKPCEGHTCQLHCIVVVEAIRRTADSKLPAPQTPNHQVRGHGCIGSNSGTQRSIGSTHHGLTGIGKWVDLKNPDSSKKDTAKNPTSCVFLRLWIAISPLLPLHNGQPSEHVLGPNYRQ